MAVAGLLFLCATLGPVAVFVGVGCRRTHRRSCAANYNFIRAQRQLSLAHGSNKSIASCWPRVPHLPPTKPTQKPPMKAVFGCSA
jgi:hypothetical protein